MADRPDRAAPHPAFGHLKLRHLHLLLLLEKERSITAAAAAMNLSQPAVSAMLKEMESIFGIRMVERSTRGVTLTAGAQAARRRFSIALAELNSVREEARLAEQNARQRLRVGALTVAMVELIPRAMPIFLARAPRVQVQVVEGTVDGLTQLLMNGELDCLAGRLAPSWAKSAEDAEQPGQVRLVDEPRCIVCRAGHPLVQQVEPTLDMLAQQDWILQPEPSSTRVLFDALFLDRGLVPPVPVIESASVHSNMETVAVTDLMALAPFAVARRMIASGELHQLRVKVELAPMPLSFVWRRTGDDEPLAILFRDALVQAARPLHGRLGRGGRVPEPRPPSRRRGG
jgi:DNA-binding transcriptional LysR family regulator